MGYFSWNCENCSESLKSRDAEWAPKWQTLGVALLENGSVIRGEYDGYGSINSFDIKDRRPTIYHESCYCGTSPTPTYSGPSEGADDQGYFRNAPVCEECGVVLDGPGDEEYLCEDCAHCSECEVCCCLVYDNEVCDDCEAEEQERDID